MGSEAACRFKEAIVSNLRRRMKVRLNISGMTLFIFVAFFFSLFSVFWADGIHAEDKRAV